MGTIGPEGFVRCQFEPLISALDTAGMDDAAVRETLVASVVEDSEGVRPSVEAFMHAWLLTLPGVEWVGHTHPTAMLPLLARQDVAELARRRLFPDEIVCCGPEACLVPYVDPGLPLAVAIRASVLEYVARWEEAPRTIWLANHGLIALGKSPAEVVSGTLMAAKAARAWVGLLSTAALSEVVTLSAQQIARIHTRPDEHYRQKLLASFGR
jgi:rhamnose utilization protein RhaD (predicted bifunctional aldolase and dehydrogenase)